MYQRQSITQQAKKSQIVAIIRDDPIIDELPKLLPRASKPVLSNAHTSLDLREGAMDSEMTMIRACKKRCSHINFT